MKKKLTALAFAFAMILSVVFISGAISSDNSFSAQGQTMTAKPRRKGIARSTYAGGKYVVRKVYVGGKWVTKKVWVGSKWTAKKTWKGGRKVVSRTKKVIY
jgi:hypothetical protein